MSRHFFIVAALLSLLPAGTAGAEVHQAKEFTNSLGVKFVELPDTNVLMAVWETRLCDWEAYLKAKEVAWKHAPFFAQSPQHPVANVTVEEAVAFCTWLTDAERKSGKLQSGQSYRLPHKSEWDAAAGVKSDGVEVSAPFPWGNSWPPSRQSGNYGFHKMQENADDGFEFTAPVGSYAASPTGCFDLGGNVWEWTKDGLPGGAVSVALRGGSWMYWRRDCLESRYLYHAPAGTRSPGIGFRIVLEDGTLTERLSRQREQMVAELLEKPAVEEKEIAEATRKLKEKPAVDEKELEEIKRKLTEGPTVEQREIDEFWRKMVERRQQSPAAGQKPAAPPSANQPPAQPAAK